MQTENDENYEITGEEFKKKMSEVIKNPPSLSSLTQQQLIQPLFCIKCNTNNTRVKDGSYVFMNPIGSNIKIASYNKDCSDLVQNPTDYRYYSDNEATKLMYDAFLRNQKAQANTISLLDKLKIEKYTANHNVGKRLWFKIPCFSEETNLISAQADDDIAISPINKGANIVFCHVREKDIQDKERFFHGIPVKLFKGKDANTADDHLLCNDDGTPKILFLSRKGIKFFNQEINEDQVSTEDKNNFSFITQYKNETSKKTTPYGFEYSIKDEEYDLIKVKCEEDEQGNKKYYYKQIHIHEINDTYVGSTQTCEDSVDENKVEWREFNIKEAFYIPPLEQDVMWQKMIKKYPIMEKYKAKIFPKIEKIVKDKESDKEEMKKLENEIIVNTQALDRLKNFPNNPNIQAYTNAIKRDKKIFAILTSKKYPSIDDLVKEFAKNTNNPTLYWKAVMNERQKRNKKVDYQKCFGERGWDKSTNAKNNINLTDITKNKELKENLKR